MSAANAYFRDVQHFLVILLQIWFYASPVIYPVSFVQQYADLGSYDGARPVLGVWTVDMEPAGLGIRESDGYITNNLSRFVPHVLVG